jgi:hypothetical protein
VGLRRQHVPRYWCRCEARARSPPRWWCSR